MPETRSQSASATAAVPHLRRVARSALVRPAIDAGLALVVFVLATMTFVSAPTAASPYLAHSAISEQFSARAAPAVGEPGDASIIEIATTASPNSPDAVYRRTSSNAAWVLLSLAFSVLAALNLAFVRHMRQAYVKPRTSRQG